MHKVVGSRIVEIQTGREVMWRGVATPYAFGDNDPANPRDFKGAWVSHMSQINAMGLNTIRLAFRFPRSTPGTGRGGDDLDYAKLDWVLGTFSAWNLKAILDLHNYADMAGDFGSRQLLDDWADLASHIKGNPVLSETVAAYEIFNEPYYSTWADWIMTKADVVTAYRELTNEIRRVDPQHIVIWESSNYLPDLLSIKDQLMPNTVFTFHRWWTNTKDEIVKVGVEKMSYITLSYAVSYRDRLEVPFWLGEFGTHNPYDVSNPEFVLTEQNLWRCEEQVVGWNLWFGPRYKESWTFYLPFFPLKVYNKNLVRQPWLFPFPNLLDYVVDSQGVDLLEPYQAAMWHNNDFVTLRSGIVVHVTVKHKLADGTFETVTDKDIPVVEVDLTITNREGTPEFPGDWNTTVTIVGYLPAKQLSLSKIAAYMAAERMLS